MKISRTKSDAHCYASTMATVYNCSLANVSDISCQAKRVNSGVRSTVLYCKAETGEPLERIGDAGIFADVLVPYDRGGQIVMGI